MSKKSSSFGSSFGSLIGDAGMKAAKDAVLRTQAASRRTAIEVQARKSRRNLTNPASFAVCATRVAQSG